MSKTTFVLSDDSVNSYGFRVLTEGIDTTQFEKNPVMLYMHARNPYKPSGDEVIGRWENIRKEGGKLLADAVIDEDNEFSAKIKKKVDGGFLRAASIGFDFKGCVFSEDRNDMVSGQTGPTILKSKLMEASIVDVGSNDSALRLYDQSGQAINLAAGLSQFNPKPEDMKELKPIALAAGLAEDATAADITLAVQKAISDRDAALGKLAAFENKQKEARKAEAGKLIDDAVNMGVITEEVKPHYAKLFEMDHDATKMALNLQVEKHKSDAAGRQAGAAKLVSGLGGAQGGDAAGDGKDYRWYEKNAPAELADMRRNRPEEFIKLFNAHFGTDFSKVEDIK